MTNPHVEFKSIFGHQLGILKRGNLGFRKPGLVPGAIRLTSAAVDCSIAVGAAVSHVRAITVQLIDANNANIDYAEMIELFALLDATPSDFAATGGSTGMAASTSGKLLAIVAKKHFMAITDATGKVVFNYTDTAGEAVFLGVRLPTGRLVTPVTILTT